MPINVIFRYLILIIAAIIFIFPLYWLITGSFKSQVEIWAVPPNWFPNKFSFDNYILLFKTKPLVTWIFNSVFTCLATVVFVLLFSAMAGYAYAKKKFPGNKIWFACVIVTMMMPHQVTLVPLYILCRDLGLIDSYLGLILPAIAYPFGVFLIRQFAKSIPDEIIEAATIDGAGELRTFATIILPLLLPALGALAIFSFMYTWNDYLWQLIILQSKAMLTLPLGIATAAYDENRIDFGIALTGASIAAVPMILFFLMLQRSFVQGITLGSVKG
ncbi:carbohydrate ABC transporter permease [Paenibacillus periandrae]|uniref:carbohydrate ABC transporter permease n=1 Tax=Paenibacillus periandrae TaxID=1761741 RepID=UPI001F09E195|nr:carbohydrate ABC transporter permease [Paenibacillus periandrae]